MQTINSNDYGLVGRTLDTPVWPQAPIILITTREFSHQQNDLNKLLLMLVTSPVFLPLAAFASIRESASGNVCLSMYSVHIWLRLNAWQDRICPESNQLSAFMLFMSLCLMCLFIEMASCWSLRISVNFVWLWILFINLLFPF